MIVVPALLTKATSVIHPLTSSLTLILIMVESIILIYARRQIIHSGAGVDKKLALNYTG